MSEQQPTPPSVPERFHAAVAAVRASAARRPVPWIAGGLAALLVVGSGGAVAVAAATTSDSRSAAAPISGPSSEPAPSV